MDVAAEKRSLPRKNDRGRGQIANGTNVFNLFTHDRSTHWIWNTQEVL